MSIDCCLQDTSTVRCPETVAYKTQAGIMVECFKAVCTMYTVSLFDSELNRYNY